MGKKVSELRSFIMEALRDGKYLQHLEWIDPEKMIFKLDLPHVSKYSDLNQLKMYKDWHFRNSKDNNIDLKNFDDYSQVRHSLQVSFKKSIYFKKQEEKIFRFSTDDEIKDKRKKPNYKSGTQNFEIADDRNNSPCAVASSGDGCLDENISDEFDQCFWNVYLPNPLEWESVENFLYSSNENGVMLYKFKREQNVAGTGSAICWEPSDIKLSGELNAEIPIPGIFVENKDLFEKLLSNNVCINELSGCLIFLLENRAENDQYDVYKIESTGGDIYVLPGYFIFYSHNDCRI
uniref:Uncharacterized protein n=1 Tax=Parasteatoda tepidariorum TaxID=114398 RepID=A0A2L2YQS9_PARTP